MAKRVLFVCLGNICRSPLGEGIFRHLVTERGVAEQFQIESAGVGDWHMGDPPDPRTIAVAERNGISLHGQLARQVKHEDYELFHHILAMDGENLKVLKRRSPASPVARIQLLREYDPDGDGDVPDPYFGGADGFDQVYDMIHRCCSSLLEALHGDPRP